jgi:hypothetical protein
MIPLLLTLQMSLLPPEPPLKDHGPGTSGGGLSTRSAETLPPDAVTASLRFDYTQFDRLSDDVIRARALDVSGDHAHFDAVRWTLLETLEFAFGAAEDFELGLSFGYYRADDLREAHVHGDGSLGFHEYGDVSGMTDTWIQAKGRLFKGPEGQFALFGGIKLPLGDDDEVGEDGTRNQPLEPSLQPGSGAFEVLAGAAYSRWLTERLTLDASLSYARRFEDDGFKIGGLVLFGVAAAYRFTEDMQTFPRPGVFLELLVRHLFENEEDGEEVVNSGGTTLFAGPGVRLAFSPRVSADLAVQVPVVQALNDEQQETAFKGSTGITFSF